MKLPINGKTWKKHIFFDYIHLNFSFWLIIFEKAGQYWAKKERHYNRPKI
jgi:hypothetical protein